MNANYSKSARQRWQAICNDPFQALRWDWCALVRLIQSASPDHPRIGHGIHLIDDAVRFGQPPFFHPPSVSIASLKLEPPREKELENPVVSADSSAEPPWLYAYHFGLLGPFGALPLHLTEYAYSRARAKDAAFAAFLDVLHHRFISFFFRAWADSRREVDLDRSGDQGTHRKPQPLPGAEEVEGGRLHERRTWWDLYTGALIGLGLDSLCHQGVIPDHSKLYYAGRLIQPTRNAEGLQAIVEDYFEVPAEVVSFVPRTLRLPEDVRCRLGESQSTGMLGVSIFLGGTYESSQIGFRVRLGPLHMPELEDFLPGSKGLLEMHEWVRIYAGKETDPNPKERLEAAWDLQLVLRASEQKPVQLGKGGRMGWTTWLTSKPSVQDLEDLIILPTAIEPEETASIAS